jgi:hypothetical protein
VRDITPGGDGADTSVPQDAVPGQGSGAAAACLLILVCALLVTRIVRPAQQEWLLIWGYVLTGIGVTGALLLELLTSSPTPTSWTAAHPIESGVAMFVELVIYWLVWPLIWVGWAILFEPDPEVAWIRPYLLWIGPASGLLLAMMISTILRRQATRSAVREVRPDQG